MAFTRHVSCQNDLKQIGLTCKTYSGESKGDLFLSLLRQMPGTPRRTQRHAARVFSSVQSLPLISL